MKRICAILLGMLLLACFAGCAAEAPTNGTENGTTVADAAVTGGPETTTTLAEDTTGVSAQAQIPEPIKEERFAFSLAGVTLIPGTAFEADALPEPDSVYQVPSCAIEGTDNVYRYGTVEITAFDDGTGEVIYSIYITDANTPTAEGLYIGDKMEHVVAAYGEDYTGENGQIQYQRGDTLLVIVMDGDYVASIDLRWAN